MNETNHDDRIEGLDTSEVAGWGDYPLDSVFVRTEMRTVSEIIRRISAGRYDLNPDFQRDFVWSVNKQSRLIESVLMRIPLPVFYVAEAKDGRIIVVDGLQRLTTFDLYIKGEFALSGLDDKDLGHSANPLMGKRFCDLPINLQERIEDTQLTLYILDARAPERAKLDIFERVNGGVPLTRQQMRNCLFNGNATRWLKVAAENASFLNVTDGKLDSRAMRDREVINRYCAFRLLGPGQYRGDMDGFLADALEQMNRLSDDDLYVLLHAFERSMQLNHRLFGKHAFRKSLFSPDLRAARTPINIALFDICSVLFSGLPSELNPEAELRIKTAFIDLSNNAKFIESITYATNDTQRVRHRFSEASLVIQEAL